MHPTHAFASRLSFRINQRTRTPYSLGSSNWSASVWRWPTGGGRRLGLGLPLSFASFADGRCLGGFCAARPSAEAGAMAAAVLEVT